MQNFSKTFEALLSPKKILDSVFPFPSVSEFPHQIKKLLSFDYDDKPLEEKLYRWSIPWTRLLHDFYFKTEHVGHTKEVIQVAKKEPVIFISNHANTLEVVLIHYFFHLHQLGILRTLVYKEAFRLPLIREIFRMGQCLPVSVEAGKEALKKNHVLIFPEGMEFIKRYLKQDYVVKFHKGFLHIAREFLQETGAKRIHVVPVGHDGVDYTVKFWVVNQPWLVEKFIKPYLHYPFFILPKVPLIFPSKVVMNWGVPRSLTFNELKDDKSISKLTQEFRGTMVRLRHRARQLRKMDLRGNFS